MRVNSGLVLVLAAVAALTWGAWAIADRERPVTSADLDRASKAAVAAVGGGQAVSVDRDLERGATWEVEVVKPDGSHVDVLLDGAFRVVNVGPERDPGEPDRVRSATVATGEPTPAPPTSRDDDGETPIPASDVERASAAALKAVGGGTVGDVDRDTEGGATWEVEITKADGTRVDVLLDAEFKVLGIGGEQEPGEVSDGD